MSILISYFRFEQHRLFCRVCVYALIFVGLAQGAPYVIPDSIWDDRQTIPMPEVNDVNVYQNLYNRQFTQPTTRFWQFSKWWRAITNNPKQAMNVNTWDEVESSSWYEHRNTESKMSSSEIRRGPRRLMGPDTAGVWTIFKVKADGLAPGFWIKDEQGNRFIIKPEVKGYPELGTSAENITTLLFYAAGYHTPENYLTDVSVSKIRIKPGVMLVDERSVKRPMTQDDLEKIFDRIHVRNDGKVRVTASRFINGRPMGSYSFTGTRLDDPNDVYPHQHRRELRGLYVLCAWLNHHDLNSGNFFESYVTRNEKSYIQRYLLDFSSTLGASLFGAQPENRGYTRLADPVEILMFNVTTGWFYAPKWETENPITHPIVGRYNNSIFHPAKFKINYPLEAFELITSRDGYWGAKRVMSFSDSQIDAVVREGKFSDTTAYQVLADILKERRDIIGKYWYLKVNPLENFEWNVHPEKEKGRLCFQDAGVQGGLWSSSQTQYFYSTYFNGQKQLSLTPVEKGSCIDISIPKKMSNWGDSEVKEIEVVLETRRSNAKGSPKLRVYIQSIQGSGYALQGMIRD